MTSAIGFIIGLALFGAVTYLPLYLQIVKGRSATASGLLLTPMMAGVLITSIASGNLISKTGRYKPFPIVGTAVAALAMLLLSRLAVSTPIWLAALYMLVLGLGLGMVMQVLVLAAQNAVPYKMLGVATSGSTLFRQIGGAIGVSIFGAIFANRLATELADAHPAGRPRPGRGEPRARPPPPGGGPTAVHRGVHRGDHADLPRRGRLRDRRLPASPGCCARCRSARPRRRRDRRELRLPARGSVRPRARTDPQLDRERTHADRDLPADRRRVRRRAHAGRGLAARPPRHQRHARARARRRPRRRRRSPGSPPTSLHRGYLDDRARQRPPRAERPRPTGARRPRRGRPLRAHRHRVRHATRPSEEVADILRRLAVSLLADIPRDAGREPRAASAAAAASSG